MLGAILRRAKDVANHWRDLPLARANGKSPVYSLKIDNDAVVTGSIIKTEVCSEIRGLMEHLSISAIQEEENFLGIRLLISDIHAKVILKSLEYLANRSIITTIYYYSRGKRQKFTVSSIGAAELARKRVAPNSVYCMRFHKGVRASNSMRSYGASFKSEIRFLHDSEKWWLNPLVDIESPDIEKSCLKASRLPSATDVTCPIDIVYTWVDGSDSRWLARKDDVLRTLGRSVPEHSVDRSRWHDRDELLYSLRSVALFAPWVRRIYLVTDDQIPDWLRRDGAITVVDHRELFPAGSALPTFNSHAIEAVLHRIEGLSEHFLYMNDDVFFGGVVAPENFFTSGGLSRAFLSPSSMPIGDPADRDRASEWGGMNASRLIEAEFGRVIRQKARHTPMALRVSVIKEMEERFSGTFEQIRSSQFRDPSDIAPLSYLYPNYSLLTGRSVISDIRYGYFNIDNESSLRKMRSAVRSGSGLQVFCLNDTGSSDAFPLSWHAKEKHIRDFLNGMYPWKSPWET